MILAIDYGKKRIGLAIGTVFPHGAGILDGAEKLEKNLLKLKQIISNNEISEIVLGWPVRSHGEPGTLAPEIRHFAQKLSNVTNLPVYFEPEQFTSSEAAAYFKEMKSDVSRQSGKIDELSAVLILEQFLNRKKEGNITEPDITPRRE